VEHVAFGAADTVLVAGDRWIYWFLANGAYLRRLDLLVNLPLPSVLDVLSDGTLLRLRDRDPGGTRALTRIGRNVFDLEVLTEGGRKVVPLGDALTSESLVVRDPDSGVSFGGFNVFGPRHQATGGSRPLSAFVADRERWEVRAYDGEGALREVFRLGVPRVPITDARIGEVRQAIDSAYSKRPGYVAVRSTLLSLQDALDKPDSVPGIRRVFWDEEGYLWLEHNDVQVFSAALPRTFEILAADGTWLGRVDLPFHVVHQISRGRILAGHLDELGVPYLRVYRVRRE
jgi:hypothetical protein